MRDSQSSPVVLLAFANDLDDRAHYLRTLKVERRRLCELLEEVEDDGCCELVIRPDAMVDEILDVFMERKYRDRIAIFHYAGHANSYQLLFETAEGKPAPADAASLADFLANQTGLKLVFLNGCSTEGQAQGLLDAGVSVVIATSQAVIDGVATEFAERFYQGLAGGAKVRRAFQEAGAAVKVTCGRSPRHLYRPKMLEADLADRVPWVIYPPKGAEGVEDWGLPEPTKVLQPELIAKVLKQGGYIPAARAASGSARKSAEYNCQQIKSIADYKKTHDLLQRVEGSYCALRDQLYDEGGELRPLEARDWAATVNNRTNLQRSIGELLEEVEMMPFRAQADAWLRSLRQSSDDLQAAYDGKEKELLERTLIAVDDVIKDATSHMNADLIGGIDHLHLLDLIAELDKVYKMVEADSDPFTDSELQDFERAIARLGKMSDRLASYRQEHDEWQRLYDKLRNEEKQLKTPQGIGRFKKRWEVRLREKMLALCSATETEPKRGAASRINELDAALAATPVKRDDVLGAFAELLSATISCFHKVNHELKTFCGKLKDIGDSLEAALERL